MSCGARGRDRSGALVRISVPSKLAEPRERGRVHLPFISGLIGHIHQPELFANALRETTGIGDVLHLLRRWRAPVILWPKGVFMKQCGNVLALFFLMTGSSSAVTYTFVA